MGVLDFRRFLPGQPQDYAGVQGLWQPGAKFAPTPDPQQALLNIPTQYPGQTFWATGGGPTGPGTFSVPVQADGAPQQKPPPAEPPKPPPETTPKPVISGDTNPAGKPPVMAGVGGLTTMSPMGTTVPVTPQTQTLPATTGRTKEVVPAYGPGASQPSVTKAPTQPIEPAFNPDTREAVRKATPPAGTSPDGTPATQSGNLWDKVMALQKDGKLGPAIAALAKIGGGGGGPAPPAPWRSSLQGGNPGYHPGNPGSAAQVMQGLTGGAEKREAERLKKMAAKRRQQERYDILRGEG